MALNPFDIRTSGAARAAANALGYTAPALSTPSAINPASLVPVQRAMPVAKLPLPQAPPSSFSLPQTPGTTNGLLANFGGASPGGGSLANYRAAVQSWQALRPNPQDFADRNAFSMAMQQWSRQRPAFGVS